MITTMIDVVMDIDISIPLYWTRSRSALLHSADGRLVGTITRSVEYRHRFLGMWLAGRDILQLHLDDVPTPACRIALKASFPLEFLDPNGKTVGFIRHVHAWLHPEFTCTDLDGKPFGTITSTGLLAYNLTSDDLTASARYSPAKSRGTRPRLAVWEFRASGKHAINPRLLLAFVALKQMPDYSG